MSQRQLTQVALLLAAAALLAACGTSTPAPASRQSRQPSTPSTQPQAPTQSAAQTKAPQRADPEAAKREGKVVWYTSIPTKRAETIAGWFEKDHGIKVQVYRSGGSEVLQKFMLEADAGRIQNDLLTVSDPSAFGRLRKQGLLVAYKPVNFEKVIGVARDPDGYWVASRQNAMVMAYRTDKLKGDQVPHTWKDLLKPEFKGKVAHIDPNFSANALNVVAGLAKTFGWEYYGELARNDVMLVKGNQQIMAMVTSGERLIAHHVNATYVAEEKEKGQPVEVIYPEDGVFMVPSPTAVIKGGPNPNAALLFADYLLSDKVQKLMVEDGNYSSRTDIAAPPGQPALSSLKTIAVDHEWLENNAKEVRQEFGNRLQSRK